MAPCDLHLQFTGLRGSTVEGSLSLIARSAVVLSRISISLRGTSTTLITSTGTKGTPMSYSEEHIIIDEVHTVSTKYTELSTGDHHFPFAFSLPDYTQCKPSKGQLHVHGPLPPSYTSPYLQIRYQLTATVYFKKSLFGSKLTKSLVVPLNPPQAVTSASNRNTLIQKKFTIPPPPEPPKSFISYLIFGEDEPKPQRPLVFEIRCAGVLQLGGPLPLDMSFVSKSITRLNLQKVTISLKCIMSIRAKGLVKNLVQWVTLCDVISSERLHLTDGRAVIPKSVYDSVVTGIPKSFKVCNAITSYELHVQCEVSGVASLTSETVNVKKAVEVVEHDLPSYDEVVGPQMSSAGIVKAAQ